MVDPSTSLVLILSCQEQERELGSLFPRKRDCSGTYRISVGLNLCAGLEFPSLQQPFLLVPLKISGLLIRLIKQLNILIRLP